jgi:hypothetical protein
MPLPTSLRRRRGRHPRLAAAACLAALGGAAAVLLSAGPVTPTPTAAANDQCLPLLCTPQPSPSRTPTPRPSPTRTPTPKPKPTASHTNPPPPPPTSSSSFGTPVFVPPEATAPPTLPPPSPGAPPEPPTLEVQTVQLDLASEPAARPGAEVLLQATMEAQRGTDTYAVPHAAITFTIASQPGVGAFVDPPQADGGDTGVVVVTVQTSDQAGDTVVHAVSGGASADFTVHADPPTPSPTPQRTAKPAGAPPVVTGSGGGPRPLMVAGLSALLAAVVGGYATALALGRLPNPLQRRVWGRRQAR